MEILSWGLQEAKIEAELLGSTWGANYISQYNIIESKDYTGFTFYNDFPKKRKNYYKLNYKVCTASQDIAFIVYSRNLQRPKRHYITWL